VYELCPVLVTQLGPAARMIVYEAMTILYSLIYIDPAFYL